jgi:hypothetical protein
MRKFVGLILPFLVVAFLGVGSASATPIWFVTQGTGGNYQQNQGHLWDWDPDTNTVTDRGVLNRGAWGDIAMTPGGDLYGISWNNGVGGGGTKLYKITPGNATTAASYTVVSSNSNRNLNGLGWDNGDFWALARGGGGVYRWEYNTGTGLYDLNTVDGGFDSGGDVEIDRVDGTLYAVSDGLTPSNLYTIDRTTGVPTNIRALDRIFFGLGYSGGNMYGFDNDQQGYGQGSDIYLIDPSSSTTTLQLDLAGTIVDAQDNVWGSTSAPIPEPATMILLGFGLLGLLGYGIHRKKKS